MKVVLSRKGLDSQYGGIPSPIIKSENGYRRFYPIPIPDELSDVRYSDLVLFSQHKVSDFLHDVPLKSMKSESCHLDPDIRQSYLPKRPAGWQGAFGQSHIAQDHLRIQEVGEGDVFLFFGWFQFAELKDDRFQFVKKKDYPNGFHAVYGYLQVKKMYDLLKDEPIPSWLEGHPHVKYKSLEAYKVKSNAIYTADQFFCHNGQKIEKNGSALFTFSEDLILTQKGQDKRTRWELPSIFHPDNGVELSYNPTKNWGKENGKATLKSAYKGQEFVVKADPDGKVEEWCYWLIMNHTITE